MYAVRLKKSDLTHIYLYLQHEQASVQMLEHLITSNKLRSKMEYYGLKLDEDMDFIKEQIASPVENKRGVEKVSSIFHIPGSYLNVQFTRMNWDQKRKEAKGKVISFC